MRNFENYIFAIILVACLWSCGHTGKVRPILDRAEMCMESHPDSAFVTLDSLDRRLLDTPELRARHALLYSQALEKCGIEIYNDSIILIALDYYASIGDSENTRKARACLDRINENASMLAPSDTLKVQNARIIEERYSDKMTLVKKDERMRNIIIISILAWPLSRSSSILSPRNSVRSRMTRRWPSSASGFPYWTRSSLPVSLLMTNSTAAARKN